MQRDRDRALLLHQSVRSEPVRSVGELRERYVERGGADHQGADVSADPERSRDASGLRLRFDHDRSEEHTSELQSLMRNSYAVFCLKKKKRNITNTHTSTRQ